MSKGNGDRPTAASDIEYSYSFMQKQLEDLPGEIEEPTNAAWQRDTVNSVEHKAAVINQHNPELGLSTAGLLRFHAERLRILGPGGITSANALFDLADRIAPTPVTESVPASE